MKNSRSLSRAAAAAAALLSASGALAQWTSDPSVNTPISTAPGSQDLCKVARTADGGCYIAWFASVPGPIFWNVRLQRLNAAGLKQLGDDGILVSDNPNTSATFGDWDLQTDSAGNALLVFNDARPGTAGGTDHEMVAYRIAPDGSMLWGANGVLLTDDTVDNFVGRIAQTTDGNFAVVFDRSAAATGLPRGLLLQRLDASGNILLAPGGVLIAGAGIGGAGASDGPGFFQMVPSDNNSVIVFYAKDTRSFTSPRYPTIQKYGPTGTGLWNGGNAVQLFNSSFPIAYYPNLISDGAGGAYVSWHDNRPGAASNVWVQHVDSTGAQVWTAGGVAASINNTGRGHYTPTVPVIGPSGELYVFWSERDSSQGMRSLNGQKIDATGARQWGDGGIAFTPFDTVVEDFMRANPVAGAAGAIVVFKETATGTTQDFVRAIRVNESGFELWNDGNPITVSSVGSSKGRFPTTTLADGAVVSVWSDNRSADGGDIYAQRINTDGTLGGPPMPTCPADYNHSGLVSVQDIFDFLAGYFANDPAADFNHSGAISVQDIFDFLAAYFTPCP